MHKRCQTLIPAGDAGVARGRGQTSFGGGDAGGQPPQSVQADGSTSLRAVMARRSLRPELNRIRAWVRQGRTDAWIAHQLEVTVQQIQAFKREQGLVTGEEPEGAVADYDDEIDLRAEDDALIAAELDAAEEAKRSAGQEDEEAEDEEDRPSRRRRGRRGGRPADVARPPRRWRRRSIMARRGTDCGSTRRCRTTPSTRSTGPGIARSRS